MSEIRVTTLKDTSGGNSSTTADIYSGRAKAWVNFNGSGVVAIRAQFNVSSITDNGTGDYTVNFSNAMTDANYSAVAMIWNGWINTRSKPSWHVSLQSNPARLHSSNAPPPMPPKPTRCSSRRNVVKPPSKSGRPRLLRSAAVIRI